MLPTAFYGNQKQPLMEWCCKTTLQGTITYPTKREKENHRLKSALGRGYVSSQEGMMLSKTTVEKSI